MKVSVGSSRRDGANLAVGHQAQLDERLEAVADAQGQAVALVQQTVDGVGHRRVAEEGRNELGGAVRLVAAGETARQHQNLRLVKLLHQRLAALGHVSGGEVLQNQNVRIAAGTAEGAGRVVFAVRAGEHRDDDPRRRQAHSGGHTLVGRAVMLQCGYEFTGLAVGEHRLELLLPQLLQAGQVDVLALGFQRVVHGGKAQELTGGGIQQFQDDRAVGRLEQAVQVDIVG